MTLHSHLKNIEYLSLAALETGFFNRDATTIPQIGARWSYQGLVDELFDVEVGVIKVIEAKKPTGREVDAYFVATVLGKKPTAIPSFEEIKTEVIDGTSTVDGLRTEKAKGRALADAQRLFDQRADVASLDDLL